MLARSARILSPMATKRPVSPLGDQCLFSISLILTIMQLIFQFNYFPSFAASVPNKHPMALSNYLSTTMVAENPFKFEKYSDHLKEMVCFEHLMMFSPIL